MGRGAEPSSPISSHSTRFSFLALLLAGAVMAWIRRFSAAEKGKAPLNEPELLPPKKRRSHRREMFVRPVVLRHGTKGHLLGTRCPCMLTPRVLKGGAMSAATRARAVVTMPQRCTPSSQGSMPRTLHASSCYVWQRL